MNNLGRGFWIPSTPDKPFSQSENWPQISIGEENWQELLGIYNEFLQNDICNGRPRDLNLNSFVSPSPRDDEVQHSMLQQNSNPTMVFGLNIKGQNSQNLANWSFNATGHGAENFGEVVVTPQKVNSVAELMGVTNNKSSTIVCPHSRVESNQVVDISSVGDIFQQSPVLHSNCDVGGGCNLPEMTNSSRRLVRNYNLNLPPRPEAAESSNVARPFPFGPVTPGPQKQAQIAQVSHFFSEVSPQEKLTQRSEILLSTPSQSAAAVISTSLEENGGIDLNQTPQQKPPSSRKKKHRPKVIREGKPKRTPKPASADGSPKVKRKYVRKNGVNALETPSAADVVNVVEASNAGPTAKKSKSRKRKLNFDDNGEKKESPAVNNNDGRVKLPFNLNLDAPNAEWSTELNGPSASVANGNTYGPKKHETKMTVNNFVHSLNKISPQDSLTPATMAPPRDHRLNVIARNVNLRNASSANQVNDQCISGGQSHRVNHHTNACLPNLYSARQSAVPIQGAERLYSCSDLMGSQLWSNEGHRSRNNISLTGEQHRTSSCTISGVANVEDFSGQTGSRSKNFQAGVSANSDIRGQIISRNLNGVTRDWSMNSADFRPEFQQQHASSQARLFEQVATNTSQALTVVTDWNLGSASQRDPKSTPINDVINLDDRVAVKRRTAGQKSSNKAVDKEAKNRRNYRNTPKKFAGTGSQEEERMASIDYITEILKELQIYDSRQSALVPYKRDGAVVPYEEFDPVKKRRPRPRVDLDPETNRLWNLLMGSKEGGASAETMDTDKQKWWEEERKVFRGRVDSFIARMHLVQGDRRFSKWKGSVVDSVIGVFLTQNVSDHLSSSAFMSLAAKFPLKPTTVCQPSEHHEVRITYPDGTSYDHKILREPSSNRSSVTSTESSLSEYRAAKHVISEKRTEEDIISSQSSSESTVFQNFRSSSGSNSEADDGWNLSKNLGYLSELSSHPYKELLFGQSQGPAASSNAYSSYPFISNYEPNLSLGLEKWELDVLASSEKESSISTLASTDPTRPAETPSKQPNGNWKHATHEPTKTGLVNSSDKQADTATPNARKRKAEKEKVGPFDWDILRKEVQSKEGGTRERSRETMDSLDYETLRNADVREISDTIKERGMNNMLAERMKSFLNRLVQDHERIDLEWLRDVDSDKVKDYLLSIRGLGLKSVECVRLLTLHHLAFPVDTNVGRIAVRLGWVPLQPLPESLQLHLLELYPVLETIQKYLWPRLCKLDQETLYELHYQMITFGKVFCTKREPNCNGCPMRGECRHFASAFASARLALPGPEEKRIVTSAAPPVTPNKRPPDVIIKPMLLHSSEEGNIETGFTRNYELPLIEEPSTPEPEPPTEEVSERDIEDAFYEDPDEIPVIRLDVQEFTNNLQSFMQQQMELGEADMSKALVALSPEFASIPLPKLKQINRLRTEHQVYELPDSHPLLNGMDRREPDDPSPYLLAIWTPGETADSVQPPESTCSSREGGGGLGSMQNGNERKLPAQCQLEVTVEPAEKDSILWVIRLINFQRSDDRRVRMCQRIRTENPSTATTKG
ncbi:transcriptional activator demeter [Phtheirospermum japonicum]|uniref:Transcriptional activator demeter n=1 Tax=Phtheirospermum japonicum TaxID=374723 RepID=A0A830CPK3_9LAMI|nr:transcriptional activator demeter [Phtheirospermum japonicum]